MSRRVSLDPSRRLDIFLRIGRDGDLTFPVFTNEVATSMVYEDFNVIFKRYSGDINTTLLLTVGSGITLVGNEIQVDITAAQSFLFSEGKYYWELLSVDDNETWISGEANFHNGPFDAVNDDISIELQEHEVVNLYITL